MTGRVPRGRPLTLGEVGWLVGGMVGWMVGGGGGVKRRTAKSSVGKDTYIYYSSWQICFGKRANLAMPSYNVAVVCTFSCKRQANIYF